MEDSDKKSPIGARYGNLVCLLSGGPVMIVEGGDEYEVRVVYATDHGVFRASFKPGLLTHAEQPAGPFKRPAYSRPEPTSMPGPGLTRH